MRVLADENIPDISRLLGDRAEVRQVPGRSIRRDHLLDQQTEVLLVRSVTRVNRALLEGTAVRFVGTATSGVDHINQTDLAELGIEFVSAPGCNALTVVQYVMSVFAALEMDPRSRHIGIIGCGQVGGLLYRQLQELGCKLSCYDPFLSLAEIPDLTDMGSVLQADVLCLHTPLTQTGPYPTAQMIGAAELARMGRETVLINAGRGGVIDEAELLEWQARNPAGRLVLDVWCDEPLTPAGLYAAASIMTPHIAGYSELAKRRGAEAIASRIPGIEGVEKTAECPAIRTEISATSWSDAVLQVFDPRVTTRQMASLVGASDGFDELRKSYGNRLEFSQVSVNLPHPEDRLTAGKLGFAIA